VKYAYKQHETRGIVIPAQAGIQPWTPAGVYTALDAVQV